MDRCPAGVVLDYDSIDCRLERDHDGLHMCSGEGGDFEWKLSPRPWPTDLEIGSQP